MSIKIFVPIFQYNNSFYGKLGDITSEGIFRTEKEAVHSLIDVILDNGRISYDNYCDVYDDIYLNENDTEKEIPKLLNEEEFINMLKLAETEDELMVLCEKHDTSGFQNVWWFEIFIHELN